MFRLAALGSGSVAEWLSEDWRAVAVAKYYNGCLYGSVCCSTSAHSMIRPLMPEKTLYASLCGCGETLARPFTAKDSRFAHFGHTDPDSRLHSGSDCGCVCRVCMAVFWVCYGCVSVSAVCVAVWVCVSAVCGCMAVSRVCTIGCISAVCYRLCSGSEVLAALDSGSVLLSAVFWVCRVWRQRDRQPLKTLSRTRIDHFSKNYSAYFRIWSKHNDYAY